MYRLTSTQTEIIPDTKRNITMSLKYCETCYNNNINNNNNNNKIIMLLFSLFVSKNRVIKSNQVLNIKHNHNYKRPRCR